MQVIEARPVPVRWNESSIEDRFKLLLKAGIKPSLAKANAPCSFEQLAPGIRVHIS